MLIVVRHGRTAANAAGRLLGRADPPLDDVGIAQAAAVAARLADLGVVRVVTSPLQRARETAAVIAAVAGVEPEVDERWVEVDYGVLDGTPLTDVPTELWARWRDEPEFAPDEGESLGAVARRVASACDDLWPEAAEAHVVAVSHVSPVKAAAGWALGVGHEVTWRTFVSPGSIMRIAAGPVGPVLHSFGERP